jgi:tryptophanyl-tRNA synthetase
MQKKHHILTGHRPTGPRHLGHLVGTLNTWKILQDSYNCFFLIADLHVLTTDFEHPEKIQANTLDTMIDWLSVGLDPQRSTFILQSGLPEHSQFCLLLSMLVTAARLERIPTFKEQVRELNLTPSLGLLTYPVLQTADILLYKADTVPVGEDQLPHLELARELARRFNQLYAPIFTEPEALLSNQPRLPGVDNRTMHNSYGNTIYLKDTAEETTRKIMQMYTDPTRIHPTDPGHVEGNPLFIYLDTFDPEVQEVDEIKARYRAGTIGDVAVKQRLATILNAVLAPLRQTRAELASHPDDVLDILYDGTRRARPVAQETLEQVLESMGLQMSLSFSRNYTPNQLSGAYC